MNRQIAGVLRILLTSVLGGLIAKGIITPEQSGALVESIASIVGILAMAAWSWVSNEITSVISHVAKSDEVTKVVVADPAVAAADPSPKVVADPMSNIQ